MVIATQNPIELEGTYPAARGAARPLPDAHPDRLPEPRRRARDPRGPGRADARRPTTLEPVVTAAEVADAAAAVGARAHRARAARLRRRPRRRDPPPPRPRARREPTRRARAPARRARARREPRPRVRDPRRRQARRRPRCSSTACSSRPTPSCAASATGDVRRRRSSASVPGPGARPARLRPRHRAPPDSALTRRGWSLRRRRRRARRRELPPRHRRAPRPRHSPRWCCSSAARCGSRSAAARPRGQRDACARSASTSGPTGRIDLTVENRGAPRHSRCSPPPTCSTTAAAPPASSSRRSPRAPPRAPRTASPPAAAAATRSARSSCARHRPVRARAPALAERRTRAERASSGPASTTSSRPSRSAAGSAADARGRRARAPMVSDLGDEFLTLREYELGDDLRRVHWRSTARTGELMIRQDEARWRSRAAVVLDVQPDGHDARVVRGRGGSGRVGRRPARPAPAPRRGHHERRRAPRHRRRPAPRRHRPPRHRRAPTRTTAWRPCSRTSAPTGGVDLVVAVLGRVGPDVTRALGALAGIDVDRGAHPTRSRSHRRRSLVVRRRVDHTVRRPPGTRRALPSRRPVPTWSHGDAHVLAPFALAALSVGGGARRSAASSTPAASCSRCSARPCSPTRSARPACAGAAGRVWTTVAARSSPRSSCSSCSRSALDARRARDRHRRLESHARARSSIGGWQLLRTAPAPAPVTDGALLLAVVATLAMAAIADWLAFRRNTALGAIAPALVLFVWTSTLGTSDHGSRARSSASRAATGRVPARAEPRRARPRPQLARVARRRRAVTGSRRRSLLGRGALVVGVVVVAPPSRARRPSRSSTFAEPRTHDRSAGASYRTGVAPLVDIGAKLDDVDDHELFTVAAAQPDYWRITALDRVHRRQRRVSGRSAPRAATRSSVGLPATAPDGTLHQEFRHRAARRALAPRRVPAGRDRPRRHARGQVVVDARRRRGQRRRPRLHRSTRDSPRSRRRHHAARCRQRTAATGAPPA